MTREQLKSLVDDKIDDAFVEYFDSMDIQSGDITPLQTIELDKLEDELVNFILRIAEQNMYADEKHH